MIRAEITSDDGCSTTVGGKTINEIIQKIKDYHTMSQFEMGVIIEKDGHLEDAKASGWYYEEEE